MLTSKEMPRPQVKSSQPLMSEDDLPPRDTKRWVMRRKADVVFAVRCGLLTLEQACDRYNLSAEEISSWQRLVERHGIRGLRATRLQQYRSRDVKRGEVNLTNTGSMSRTIV